MSAAAALTLGTAGHIDHGKTALIRALTGVDTDRLPQERERGISIELGYARLVLPSGRALSVIDAPGHERFVRTMVAGATGVDLYLMTVAADDGVMPQTREHAAVLHALGLAAGVVAVTKSDLADPELAMLEASELLPGAELVAVSAKTGEGLETLRATLDRVCAAVKGRAELGGAARLHVDRVFTIRGAGTVVTGTLWSGTIGGGDSLRLLPRGRDVRVRSVEVHDQALERAGAGQRVAVNLVGVGLDAVGRGDVLAGGEAGLAASYVIDAALEFVEGKREPEHGQRVQVHHGTRESPARLAWLGGRFWQIRLEQPLLALAGDRLVVRQIAPPDTLGGGVVLEAGAKKHGPSREALARLERLARGESVIDDQPPVPAGKSAPPAEDTAPELSESALALEQRFREARFEPPLDSEVSGEELASLRAAGRAIRVSRNLHFHPHALAEVRRRVLELAKAHGGEVTLAQLRDELGTSRKFAQALLEHLDAEKVTIRAGEAHRVRRSAYHADQSAAGG